MLSPTRLLQLLIAGALLLETSSASAQVFVEPRRAFKGQVRSFRFDWRYIDILATDELPFEDKKPGPNDEEGKTSIAGPDEDGKESPATTPAPEGSSVSDTAPQPDASPKPGAAPESQAPGAGGAVGPDDSKGLPPPSGPAGANGASTGGPNGSVGGSTTAEASGSESSAAATPVLGPSAQGGSVTAPQPQAPASPESEPGKEPMGQAGLPQPPVTDPFAPRPDVGGGKRATTDNTGEGQDEEDKKPKGGVRLYFYEREHKTAERAAGVISRAYHELAQRFNYVPRKRFEYFLYSTYQEFLQTNLFPLEEGVLGVTSPIDLKLTLPYLGDDVLFNEVSTHEMTHQFTIQKIMTCAKEAKVDANPLEGFPLWFIEGLAEYYAKEGLDPETEMMARDLVVNPDIDHGYALLDFWEDIPYRYGNGSFIVTWIYKIGQTRVAFLEETYGAGTVQRIIDRSPELVRNSDAGRDASSFAELIERITGDPERVVAARWEEWMKRRAYPVYMDSKGTVPDPSGIVGWTGRMNALNASPNGNLVMFRTQNMDTGQTELVLLDQRAPDDDIIIAEDGVPGIESLHPVFNRNFDLTDDSFVFIAEAGGRDVLYWQKLTSEVRPLTNRELAQRIERQRTYGTKAPRETVRVKLTLGVRARYELSAHGIIAAESPSISPDGKRVAFIAINEDGVRDVYVLDPKPDGGAALHKITDDVWSERAVAWGPQGVVFTSDATEHGHFNLFAADPDGKKPTERLTNEERDESDPEVLPDGRLLFVSYGNGRADVHEVVDSSIVRRTGVATGLFDISPGPDGGVWALLQQSGQRRPVRLGKEALEDVRLGPSVAAEDPPTRMLPERSLEGAEPYSAYEAGNWQLGTLFGFLGAGGGSIFGEVIASASDRLRNHALFLDLAIYGSPELMQGNLIYLNQENLITYGGGLFQQLSFRVDRDLAGPETPIEYGERFYGVLGAARYPFNSFQYIEGDLAIGGVSYFLTQYYRDVLTSPTENGTGGDLLPEWVSENGGTRFQTELSVRLGHDTVRYNGGTGPFQGNSVLLEGTVATQPQKSAVFGQLRADAAQYFQLVGSANFFLRGGVGTSLGGNLARQFYLSSFDTLRGVSFGDTDFLLGRNFYFATAELQFPLTSIVRVVFLPNIEGVVGLDFGGVGDDMESLIEKRVFDVALGTNFIFGPLVLRLHFARPIDTGGNPRAVGVDRDTPDGGWVTNFSLNWLYL